jgi:hypothetical protein
MKLSNDSNTDFEKIKEIAKKTGDKELQKRNSNNKIVEKWQK